MLFALGSVFLANIARLNEITHDMFHEMSLARESIIQGQLPTHDVFAFTPTVHPSVHHEWGTGMVLYWVTIGSGWGAAGLMLLKFALIAVLGLVLFHVARLRGAHPLLFAATSVIVFPMAWVGFATLRAQLFTLVFIAIQLWFFELDRRGRRGWTVLWWIMLVAWLNLHAGFVVGLGLMSLHGLERTIWIYRKTRRFRTTLQRTWHLWALIPGVAMALPLNPYGWSYVPYLISALSMPRPSIVEWLPLWYTHAPLLTMSALTVALGLAIYAIRPRRSNRRGGVAALAIAAWMALRHIRHGSIFAVLWVADVPAWLSRTTMGREAVGWILARPVAVRRWSQVLILISGTFACYHQFWRPLLPATPLYSTVCTPVGSVDYLRSHHFQGNLLTPFHAGAYVTWELYPDVKISLDGRYEVAFPMEVMANHDRFYEAGRRWWEILDTYSPDAALIPQQAAVRRQLDLLSDDRSHRPLTHHPWRIVYEDDSYVIISRPNADLSSVDRRGQNLADGAVESLSQVHAARPIAESLRDIAN